MALARSVSLCSVGLCSRSKTCYLSPPSLLPVADILLLSVLIAPVGLIRAAEAVCSVAELTVRAALGPPPPSPPPDPLPATATGVAGLPILTCQSRARPPTLPLTVPRASEETVSLKRNKNKIKK